MSLVRNSSTSDASTQYDEEFERGESKLIGGIRSNPRKRMADKNVFKPQVSMPNHIEEHLSTYDNNYID